MDRPKTILDILAQPPIEPERGYQGGSSRKSRVRRRIRETLFAQQNGRCACCGLLMILGPYREDGYQPPALATLDHIVPRAKGGTWAIKNLQLLRRDCNERKGSGPHGAMEFGETEAGQLQEELRRWLGASPLRNSAGK